MGKPFLKGPENFMAVRREAFSSAKQASEQLPISCCNGSWCQVVFESQRFIIQSHINSTANQICDLKKKKQQLCNKKIQHRNSDKLLILLRIITVSTSREHWQFKALIYSNVVYGQQKGAELSSSSSPQAHLLYVQSSDEHVLPQ